MTIALLSQYETPLRVLFSLVPRDRKIDKPRQKLRIGNSRGFPQLWIHADRSEAWDRIQLVEEEFPTRSVEQQIDSSRPLALDR
jgi:hypothetical protein